MVPGARFTEMNGAELDDILLGARLDNQGHWAKAQRQQCLPEQRSTAPGARLIRDDQSRARRSFGWSNAGQPRALEQGSTVPTGAGLDGPWSKGRSELCSTIA